MNVDKDYPKAVALKFNDCINNRDIDGISKMMTSDYTFIDSEGMVEHGKNTGIKSWRGFFQAFPEYKNIFERIETTGNIVTMLGRSVCPNNEALDGPAIWMAKISSDKVSEWRVYEDTLQNRELLGI